MPRILANLEDHQKDTEVPAQKVSDTDRVSVVDPRKSRRKPLVTVYLLGQKALSTCCLLCMIHLKLLLCGPSMTSWLIYIPFCLCRYTLKLRPEACIC